MLMLAALSLIGSTLAAAVPSEADARPKSLPFPDIAAITAVSPSSFASFQTGGLQRSRTGNSSAVDKRDEYTDYCAAHPCATSSILTWGDADTGGRGMKITNAASAWRGFYAYQNCCDAVPYKYVWIGPGETQFISFPSDWRGRIQRGVDAYNLNGQTQLLGTWFEFSWDASGTAWADVSLIRGCDGAALIWDESNGNAWKGFTQWILDGAPTGAYDMKNDGQWCIAATEKLGDPSTINTIARDWDMAKVGAEYVYVDDSHGSPVISSSSGRFASYWPEGRA